MEGLKMTEEAVKHNLDCKSDSHGQHLCYIISQGFHLSDQQQYKALVEDPKFKCQHCGRVANSEDNLCKPAEL
ncbi:MAG: hypothetical protein ACYS0C_04160 [Planctomycetota bacterium]